MYQRFDNYTESLLYELEPVQMQMIHGSDVIWLSVQ